ncbi:MAG TPA: L-threonylcarbamoyladenylate synthase [Phycisphaerales bacterium]|nr:L-threonylcarbamoyladenylate synthase [Phycisphaerales bacterium]
MPRIVPSNERTIQEAAATLRAGGVIAFPTETVYGLGACTFNETAIDHVYELKGRPADNPLIAHVLDVIQAREVVAAGAWDARCDELSRRFWPGPLTLVLPKSTGVSDRATAGRPTVAVRAPRHAMAQALLEAVGEPISAPSANRSGRVSPTSAQHGLDEFAKVAEARDLLILDGGECEVGIESTVLDLTAAPPRPPQILRHGSVTLEQLREVLGEIAAPEVGAQSASPGTSSTHYAPRTPAELVAGEHVQSAMRRLGEQGQCGVALVFEPSMVKPPHKAIAMPRDCRRYAHDLYQRLREADGMGCDRIIIESPPQTSQVWRAVHDRLRRATA